jgi:hypothetical protein
MAPDHPHQRTQEQSIRARKNQLFGDDEVPDDSSAGPRKSLRDCLRETPATPLSPLVKGVLWAVGIVVLLLLAVALATGGGKKKPRARTPPATSAAPVASRLA